MTGTRASASNFPSNPSPPRQNNKPRPFTTSSTQSNSPESSRPHASPFVRKWESVDAPSHAYILHGRDASASTGAGMSFVGNCGAGGGPLQSGSPTGTSRCSKRILIYLTRTNNVLSKTSKTSSSTCRRNPRSTKSGGGVGGGDNMDCMDVSLPKQEGSVDAFQANSERTMGMLGEDEDAEDDEAKFMD
ncbi:hypothetical protein BDN72DRAFT_904071 [Pluteus cervinus]|uniref:Uncharacterized protein n=1 Tax=Pluteus cervinus TaxID=181527 RepID=A0ACD3A7U6_9AGAR|nr:hypothetical protein BDN72DRAFT_904071 [Pluteus cervinus]